MELDQAVAKVLGIDPSQASVSPAGGGGCSSASTWKIAVTQKDGSEGAYFMKTGKGSDSEVMLKGEHASLSAIHSAVPSLCPDSYGYGSFSSEPSTHFLVTDYLDLGGRSSDLQGIRKGSDSLATKLAKLHQTPAPLPEQHNTSMFGFPVTTCCGDTPQDNSFTENWADFYANHRLRFIGERCKQQNGSDPELTSLIETTAAVVVPRLLRNGHLGGDKGIKPVIVHGDLWSGNHGTGKIGNHDTLEEVIYDSSAVYAHNEYELGIMKMFGGFGSQFLKDYHRLCPKTDPVEEYEDRVHLYELYHHLNHHALFGGGYRSGAVNIMKKLISKYGKDGDLKM